MSWLHLTTKLVDSFLVVQALLWHNLSSENYNKLKLIVNPSNTDEVREQFWNCLNFLITSQASLSLKLFLQSTYHYPSVYKAPPTSGRVQTWVFLCTCNSNIPDRLPGCIQGIMYRKYTRMMGSHCILVHNRDVLILHTIK